jgi:hypothetical protein
MPGARAAAETARQYDEPVINDYVLCLLGLIAKRQGDVAAARDAFTESLKQVEALLERNAQNGYALYSKGLALCGLALCGNTDRLAEAAEAYRAARAIITDAGVVRRALLLFDALASADSAGVLAGTRAVVAGG